MTTRERIHVLHNQENALQRMPGKGAVKSIVEKRGALGDLGNTLGNVMGPPKKGLEVVKKVTMVANKENGVKENAKPLAKPNKVTVQPRKPIRQESILLKTSKLTEKTKELTIIDVDEQTKDDPQMMTEYIEDILSYVRSLENEYPVKEKFLNQSKVTSKMRAKLVNWLIDVHRNFNMVLETLHLCISVVDRYLQVNPNVDRAIFQLVGTAALLLAAKYEEVFIPDIQDFVFICDDAFTKKQILQMEIDIFKRLDFRMGWPLSIFFLRRYSKIAAVRADQHTLAKYILELALLEYDLMSIKPSLQAAAAVCLAIAVLNEVDAGKVWTATMVHYTKYKYSDFKNVLYDFANMVCDAENSKFDSVRVKYSSSKYGRISLNSKLTSRGLSKFLVVKK